MAYQPQRKKCKASAKNQKLLYLQVWYDVKNTLGMEGVRYYFFLHLQISNNAIAVAVPAATSGAVFN
jgi:hypothetical protein